MANLKIGLDVQLALDAKATLIWLNNVKQAEVYFPKIHFHFPAGFTTNYPESATGTP
jgi:hypothetical protein